MICGVKLRDCLGFLKVMNKERDKTHSSPRRYPAGESVFLDLVHDLLFPLLGILYSTGTIINLKMGTLNKKVDSKSAEKIVNGAVRV